MMDKADIPYRQNHCLGCLVWGLLRFALVSCPDGYVQVSSMNMAEENPSIKVYLNEY